MGETGGESGTQQRQVATCGDEGDLGDRETGWDIGRHRATWGDLLRYREAVQTGGDRGRRVKQGKI